MKHRLYEELSTGTNNPHDALVHLPERWSAVCTPSESRCYRRGAAAQHLPRVTWRDRLKRISTRQLKTLPNN
jgi:hypothetical protein